jgi:hypothetical protein
MSANSRLNAFSSPVKGFLYKFRFGPTRLELTFISAPTIPDLILMTATHATHRVASRAQRGSVRGELLFGFVCFRPARKRKNRGQVLFRALSIKLTILLILE